MNRFFLALAAFLSICVVSSAQHRADRQHLADPASETFILFGDPQGYVKYDLNQPILDLVMRWVADSGANPSGQPTC